MQLSPIGMPVSEMDTPALLLDLDRLQHNITMMAGHFRSAGAVAAACEGVQVPRDCSPVAQSWRNRGHCRQGFRGRGDGGRRDR